MSIKMTSAKFLIVLILTICMTSCTTKPKPKIYKHNYSKYWDKYSEKQLIDSLYADTLLVGPDTEGGWTTREFYKNATRELIADLQENKGKNLYPMLEFNKVTIDKLPLGIPKTFSNEQISQFLEIINDPVSFDWGETTYEPEYRINFLNNGKKVNSLTIAIKDMAIIKTEPDWPEYKRMKFGKIKPERYKDILAIINEIER